MVIKLSSLFSGHYRHHAGNLITSIQPITSTLLTLFINIISIAIIQPITTTLLTLFINIISIAIIITIVEMRKYYNSNIFT